MNTNETTCTHIANRACLKCLGNTSYLDAARKHFADKANEVAKHRRAA